MAKFQVGDRVRVCMVGSPLWRGFYGCIEPQPAGIASVGKSEYGVYLDKPACGDDGMWFPDESELLPLLPAIPPGWTPASEPPDNNRTVKVITKDGERFGWHGDTFTNQYGRNWAVYNEDVTLDWVRANPTKSVRSAPGEVLAWREIEPAAQVRYAVAADLPTNITVWHGSYDAAVSEARRLCVKCGKTFRVLKVVAEVKPAEPEVVRMEE